MGNAWLPDSHIVKVTDVTGDFSFTGFRTQEDARHFAGFMREHSGCAITHPATPLFPLLPGEQACYHANRLVHTSDTQW